MKRDMELIRQLLFLVESQVDKKELRLPSSIDRNQAVYHLELLEQAGYAKNNIKYADDIPMWIYSSITWGGHEFLDTIRNETVWAKVKEVVKENGGSVSMEVLKTLAIKVSETIFLG
ncbi:DUF2513 domain-containing protein [Sporosarcina sp. FA9]|uniref:DUF2513 domain-containing protein n=1 Tax=Sporosarcina sp. FA9 TaxID=3413030 RepID=UPI003F657FC1